MYTRARHQWKCRDEWYPEWLSDQAVETMRKESTLMMCDEIWRALYDLHALFSTHPNAFRRLYKYTTNVEDELIVNKLNEMKGHSATGSCFSTGIATILVELFAPTTEYRNYLS